MLTTFADYRSQYCRLHVSILQIARFECKRYYRRRCPRIFLQFGHFTQKHSRRNDPRIVSTQITRSNTDARSEFQMVREMFVRFLCTATTKASHLSRLWIGDMCPVSQTGEFEPFDDGECIELIWFSDSISVGRTA